MPLSGFSPVIRPNQSLEDYQTPFSDYVTAKLMQSFDSNPTTMLLDKARMMDKLPRDPMMWDVDEQPLPHIDSESAAQIASQAGVHLKISDEGIGQDALDLLIERKTNEKVRADAISRSPTGMRSVAGGAASLAAGALDPLFLGASMIPFVGPTRYALAMSQTTNAVSRAGVRAAAGAVQGAAGMATIEPAIYGLHQSLQDDYTALDSIMNIGFGGVLGGGLHVLGGAVKDMVLGYKPDEMSRLLKTYKEEQARAPVITEDSPITPEVIESVVSRNQADAIVNAYHGSPYEFAAFDASKIGTGEGAQAYGYGLYFAESKGVAESYASIRGTGLTQDQLSQYYTPGRKVAPYGTREKIDTVLNYDTQTGLVTVERTEHGETSQVTYRDTGADKLKVIAEIGEPKASIYKVEIPQRVVDNMLNWDKPIGQQSTFIQNAIAAIKADGHLGKFTAESDVDGVLQQLAEDLGGERTLAPHIKGGYQVRYADDAAVSSYLASKGISGIRYLDQASRASGKGTSNYVLFDAEHARIIERNGEPVEPRSVGYWEGPQGEFTPTTEVPTFGERAKELAFNDRRWYASPDIPARAAVAAADPMQREAALKTAVGQSLEGKIPEVEPIFDAAIDTQAAAEHAHSPDNVRVADKEASVKADEVVKTEPKGTALADAERALSESEQQMIDRWAATGRLPEDLNKTIEKHTAAVGKQADELSAVAKAAVSKGCI